ncbi:hypothetical protein GF420_06825 [candidate division GN15 bacterium]|nr:hypothetical protein [candidate division GN15 bacterium]
MFVQRIRLKQPLSSTFCLPWMASCPMLTKSGNSKKSRRLLMTPLSLTPSQENYIGWLFRLSPDGPVQVSTVAEKSGVQLPSVTRAMKGLADLGLVDRRAYGRIRLTDKGRRVAQEIDRRDRCLMALLVEVLGLPKEQAAREVHRLEHTVSADVLRRLEALVDFAVSSEAWIRRLRLRIDASGDTLTAPPPVAIGQHSIHVGLENET